jgi:hypothetical protein
MVQHREIFSCDHANKLEKEEEEKKKRGRAGQSIEQ